MRYKTIKELCSIVVDCPHSTPKWTDSGKIVVRNQYIKNGTIDFSSPSYTDDEHFQQRIKRAIPQAGDLIITREAPMGEVGMIPEDIECCLGQRMVLLRANPELCDNYFLLYSLQSRYVQHQISWSEGTGTTVSNLRIPHLENIKIPIVSLEKQRAIASILKALEDKIILNQRINENLKQQAQAIYMSRFTDTNGCLADICQYSKEKTFVSQLTLDSYYSTENMLSEKGGAVQAASLPTMTQTTRCCPGDVLVSNIRPYFKKIVYCVADSGCSTDVLCFTPKEKDLSTYLFYTLYTDKFFNHMVAGSKGTKMPRGDKQQIMTYPIHIPSDMELADFNFIAQPILKIIEKNREENLRLATLKDVLLPKLMSGEINTQKKNIM